MTLEKKCKMNIKTLLVLVLVLMSSCFKSDRNVFFPTVGMRASSLEELLGPYFYGVDFGDEGVVYCYLYDSKSRQFHDAMILLDESIKLDSFQTVLVLIQDLSVEKVIVTNESIMEIMSDPKLLVYLIKNKR